MNRVVAALALAAALAVAGCGGSEPAVAPEPDLPAPSGSERAQEFLANAVAGRRPVSDAPIPEGFRLRTSTADRVALAFPRGWQALTPRDARYPGVMQMFAQLNRGLGAAVAALSMPDGPVKLLGFDPRLERGFATTASVMLLGVHPGRGYDEWTAEVVRHVRELPSVHGKVRMRKVDLPLGEALRLDYVRRYGEGKPIATVQFFLNHGERGYVVTFATLPKLLKRYAVHFTASARTLRTAG